MTKLSPSKTRAEIADSPQESWAKRGIYYILNTATGKRYVGSSINIPERIRAHLSYLFAGKHHCKPLQRAFNKCGLSGLRWGILESVSNLEDLLLREQYWINAAGDYNTCPIAGSPRGAKPELSEEERARRSETMRKIVATQTPEQRAYAISQARAAQVGKPRKKEKKEKRKAATKGRKLSPEHAAKLSEINKSRAPLTEEQRKRRGEAISRALMARSDEDKEKVRARLSELAKGRESPMKGKKMSEEARAKMSKARKGRQVSEEQKKKISETMRNKPAEWFEKRAKSIAEAKAKKRDSKD